MFERDCDLTSEKAYCAYADRWEIEIVMRYYKSACQIDDTRVEDDYSVIGCEFCDFLATVLTFRLLKAFNGVKLLEKMTYKKIMSILKRIKKIRIEANQWQFIKISPAYVDIMHLLELTPKPAEKGQEQPKEINV